MTLILRGTDNSVSAPAVQGGTAGTTTGEYFPTTNQWAVATNGTQALLVDASQNATFAGYLNSPNTFGFKNRIINGAMVIDQRNAGASVTPTNGQYLVDRFYALITTASKFTAKQDVGLNNYFANSLKITSSSAYSVAAGDVFSIIQKIEGNNIVDFGFGTANAQPVTLSFIVNSSLTGTFGGSLMNASLNRSYPFSYTISSANTATTISVTIPGDTTGTWGTSTGTGFLVSFSMGTGTTFSGTAGAWGGSEKYSATGATSVVGTNGATFYITGVQLEKSSTATSFDYRPYGTELALCQRYFEIVGATSNSVLFQTYAGGATSSQQRSTFYYKVSKRASPTVTVVGTWSYSNAANLYVASSGVDASRVEWDANGAGICFAYNLNSGAYLSIASEL